jgi:hypothetical protein
MCEPEKIEEIPEQLPVGQDIYEPDLGQDLPDLD